MLFISYAQERATVVRTERRYNPETKAPYAWLVRATAMVNQYSGSCVDAGFGPFFLKFGSYFPYNATLRLNEHGYRVPACRCRQLTKEGTTFEALDNGILSCADPARTHAIAGGLDVEPIDALLRTWLAILPHPFTPGDRQAGYRYEVSILQAEFALTQVLDQPLSGRRLVEQHPEGTRREHLDLGRPDRVQLSFDRRVTKTTPGRFRTRVITEGVVPSLRIDDTQSRLTQFHKEGRALRHPCAGTRTTINDTRDFRVGKRLHTLTTCPRCARVLGRAPRAPAGLRPGHHPHR